MWTKLCFEAWTRSETALVMATAGAESRWRERKVFADGDFDLLVAPWNDLIVAPDDAESGGDRGLAVDGDLAGAVEEKTLGDEVGVVVDEGLFDELVEGVEGELDRRGGDAGEVGEVAGEFAADADDPGFVGVVEDVFVAAREADVGQRFAEGVGDFGEDEALFAVRADQGDLGERDGFGVEQLTPGEVGFLIDGRVDGAFEREVVGEGGRAAHGMWRRAEGGGGRAETKLRDES